MLPSKDVDLVALVTVTRVERAASNRPAMNVRVGLSCRSFEDLVANYVDRKLSPDERAAADAHRDGCAPCRELLEDYTSVPAFVRHVTEAVMPGPMRANLRRLLAHASRRRS